MNTKQTRILVINPGSTSTKIAIYDNTVCTLLKTLHHSIADLAPYKTIGEQYEFRKKVILYELEHDRVDLETLSIVIGRGGLTYPLKSGV
jgi:butyrate kinase